MKLLVLAAALACAGAFAPPPVTARAGALAVRVGASPVM